MAGLVESAQDSIGRALGAAQGLAEAGFGDLANRLIESAISAFNEGMTLGLGVIAGIVFLTSIVIGKFYPNDESESSADFAPKAASEGDGGQR